ncbi:MAG: hypothetical protein ABIA08_02765 [bacterium]
MTSFLAAAVVPLVVSAATDITINPLDTCKMGRTITLKSIVCSGDVPIDGPNSICCVLNTMYNIADWMFVLLVGIAGVFIIIGAMNLVMAAGDAAKVKTGRDYIMFAAIGLFVAFIARAIPGLVLMIIG